MNKTKKRHLIICLTSFVMSWILSFVIGFTIKEELKGIPSKEEDFFFK